MAENKTVRFGQKLRGAVLIMVVTVMFMLIILLLATLTVVSTAQNRAYLKYEENQAYYTARSALDVFTRNMLSDNAYYAYSDAAATKPREYYYTDPAKLSDAQLSVRQSGKMGPVKMKQGLALEFELYKIPAKNDAGFASNFKKSDGVFGSTAVALPEDENYSIDTTLTSDNGITYTVTFPAMGDGSDDYGRFVDTNSSGTQEATINVTIEERHFNFGGANANAFQDMTDAELKTCSAGSVTVTKNGTTTTYTAQQLKDAIRLGDRTKDKMRVKITSTVAFMGVNGTAALYYDTSEKPAVNSSNAITSVSDITQGSGVFPIGGASALSGGLTVDQDAVLCGSMYINGNGDTTNNTNDLRDSKIYLFKDTVHTFKGNISYTNGYPIFKEAGSIIYSTGVVSLNVAQDFAASGKETNVIAQKFVFAKDGATKTFYGNVYSDVFAITNNNSDLIFPTNNKAYTNYVNVEAFATLKDLDGDSNLDTLEFTAGSMGVSAPSIVLYKGFEIKDETGATSKFTYSSATGKITSEANPSISYNTLNVPAFDVSNIGTTTVKNVYSDPTHYTMTADMYKEFTMPENLAGRTAKTVKVPTSKAVYSEIFQPTAFVDNATDTGTNGDLNPINKPTISASVLNPIVYNGVTIPTTFVQDVLDGKVNSGNLYMYNTIPGINLYNDWADAWDSTPGIETLINNEVLNYATTNTAYKDALTAYYQNYITGAQKSGATSKYLLEYTSSSAPLTLETIDWSTVDLSAYSAADQTAIKAMGATKIIRSSGYLQSMTNYNKDNSAYGSKTSPVIIDATTNDIVIQLGAENGNGTNQEKNKSTLEFRGYFVVIGDKNVKFYLPDGDTTGKKRNYSLGNYSASGQGFHVATYDIEKMLDDGAITLASRPSLDIGNTSTATKAPNIYFYTGNSVEEITLGSPNDGFISGYIYAPFAKYRFGAGSGRTISSGTNYNGETVLSGTTSGYSIVGSIICGGYSSGNKIGVAYINPNQSTYTHGDTQFMWNAYQYARN